METEKQIEDSDARDTQLVSGVFWWDLDLGCCYLLDDWRHVGGTRFTPGYHNSWR